MNDFVICISNKSNPASLIVGKAYRKIPDTDAESQDLFRIIDEDKSELDGYLYPSSIFVPIDLPEVAKKALLASED